MKKLRSYAIILLILISLFLFAACNETVPTGYPVEYGEMIFDASPKRVISLSPGLTESLYALGYGDRIVGVSDFCDRPAAVGDMTRIGTPLRPLFEEIYALSPDLIITAVELDEEAVGIFDEMGIKVLTLSRAQDMDGVMSNLSGLIKIFAGNLNSPLLIEQLDYYADSRSSYVRDSVKSFLSQSDTTSAIYMAQPDFVLATGDTIEGVLMSDMGLENPAAAYAGWSFPQEEEPNLNPDIIFYSDSIARESIELSEAYKATSAVTEQRVYPVDVRAFERQSVLMFAAMEDMAKEAFPEAFTSPAPSFAMPEPEEPEPEPKWYDFITEWFQK